MKHFLFYLIENDKHHAEKSIGFPEHDAIRHYPVPKVMQAGLPLQSILPDVTFLIFNHKLCKTKNF